MESESLDFTGLKIPRDYTYDQEDETAAAEVKEKEFTMTATVKGKPLKNHPYTLTENGVALDGEYSTNEKGEFTLKNGQTATFEGVGEAGTEFKVVETADEKYVQIYPANSQPHEGKIESEGSSVTFVNGSPGGLMLSKEYTGADDDGKEYVALMKDKDSEEGKKLRKEAAVTMTLEVTDKEGSTVIWPTTDTKISVIDQLTGEKTEEIWSAGGTFTVEPWKTVALPSSALTDAVSYTLTEAAENQHAVYEWRDGIWAEITQSDPADDAGASGTLEENPVAKIINQISTFKFEGSEIEKRMAIGSDQVPEGAKLVWRLEQYDGSRWNPAEGIPYLIFDEDGAVTDRTLTTGEDGRILLTKTGSGYPKVKFTKDKVYLNRYQDAKKDDLRLVEVLDESDEVWGMLAGYGSADDKYSYSMSLSSEQAAAFVNSNRIAPVEIEKKMEHPTDVAFTMILKQVLSASASPVTKEEQILKSEAVPDIEYLVFDTETNEQVGSGVTDKYGAIHLKAGQYARLNLPDGTLWTVSEELKADYTLKDLSGTPEEKLTKLNSNLMLIQSRAELVGELVATVPKRISNDELEEGVSGYRYLNKKDFNVRVCYSDGTSKVLTQNEFYLSPDDVRGIGFHDIKIVWPAGGMTTSVQILLTGSTTITKTTVMNGVMDADTGKRVVLNRGDVEIPEYIGTGDSIYKVTGISSGAFENNNDITGIKMPESVTYIGHHAFSGCTNLGGILRIPSSVTDIGDRAFQNCEKLTGLILADNVTTIGEYAFGWYSGITGKLVIPGSVETIGYGAFSTCDLREITISGGNKAMDIKTMAFTRCYGLEKLTICESVGNRSFGYEAFSACSSLRGELVIPSCVTSIASNVFYGTNLTSITINKAENSITGAPWGAKNATVTWSGN